MIDPKRKIMNLVFSIVYIICLVFTMAVISFSWLPNRTRTAKEIKYNKDLIISSLNLDIEFQIFDQDYNTYKTICKYENNTLKELAEDTFINYAVKSVKLNPGDIQSYRFVITNLSTTSDIIADVSLRGLFQRVTQKDPITQLDFINYHPEGDNGENDIFNYLSIKVSNPDDFDIPVLRNNMTTLGTGTDVSLNLSFYDNLTVPAGQTINLDWYIELSTMAGNEFWGYSFGFDSIFFSV